MRAAFWFVVSVTVLIGVVYKAYSEDLRSSQPQTAIVRLQTSFDLSKLNLSGLDQKARGKKVADALSEYTHKELAKAFPLLKVDYKGIHEVTPLWITNSIRIVGTSEAIQKSVTWNSRGIESITFERTKPVDRDVSEKKPAPLRWGRNIGWGVMKLQAPKVWAKGFKGQGVVVAVLDSGLNVRHPDLATHLWKNVGEMGKDSQGRDKSTNGIDDDQNGFVDDVGGWNFEENTNDVSDFTGHGTQAAGIVAGDGTGGTQTGVAPQAEIMPLKTCCNLGEEVAESAIWEALQYALQNGAHVISMSVSMKHYGNPNYAGWRRADEVLNAAGVLHVNSAGNRGSGNEPYNIGAPGSNPPAWLHPAQPQAGNLSSMLTVGAVDPEDKPRFYSGGGPVTWEKIPEYKDFPYEGGAKSGLIKPDVCGPSETPSLAFDGSAYTMSFGGTSSATPHIAGVVALLLSADHSLSPARITEVLQQTAVPIGGKFGNQCGAGRVNAFLALEAVLKK